MTAQNARGTVKRPWYFTHLPFRHRHLAADEVRTSRAQRWFESSIATWEREGRLSADEAKRLRAEITKPQFLAVMPHFGVHLAIGAVLRFPVGSITRATYVLLNLLIATVRLLTRNIDRHTWGQAFSIHSPLVILIAGMPGIGTFAYLASRPLRSNHLLLRVAGDAVLLKLPGNVYERTGVRWVIARPEHIATQARQIKLSPLRLHIQAQSVVLVLGLLAGVLFAADLAAQMVNELGIVDPDMLGWKQVARMLDLGAETSFGTWYQVMALAFLSVLLAAVAFARRQVDDRFAWHWMVLALLTLGFSLDEQVKIHDAGDGTEALRDTLGMSGPLFFGWVLVGLASVVLVGLYYRSFVANLPQATRRLFVLAATLFVGGEIGLEAISGWYTDISGSTTSIIYQTISSFEEFLGMAGIFVAIAAMLHYVQHHYGEVHVTIQEDVVTPYHEQERIDRAGQITEVEVLTNAESGVGNDG